MSLDIPRIRALCFDVDGTLRDTDDQFVQRLVSWLEPGRTLFRNRDPRPFARWFVMHTESPGTFLFGIPDRLGFDHYLARLGDFIYQKGQGKTTPSFLLIDQVKEALDRLSQHYPMAVISARGQSNTLAFLDQFGLRHYFHSIATAQTCRHTKPYPDPIYWAAERMGVAATACLMIGDTTVDIRAGRAARAQTAGVLCGFGEENELRKAGADLILPSTHYLVDHLLASQGKAG